jgi:quercetin 2,3-dioxygenase
MMTVRSAHERGKTQIPWLDSRHTSSLYYDPRCTGFRDLVVINEDYVAPGMGFGTHGHQDTEIISYVVEGQLAHRDSTGVSSVIRPGDVQRLSAGTPLTAGDGAAVSKETVLQLRATDAAELLLFDLA